MTITTARYPRIDLTSIVLGIVVLGLLVVGGSGRTPSGSAAPPPADRFAHGAAGTARNGHGGQVAPSPTSASWPGTGTGRNGGAFAFIGAQYGSLWSIPPMANNSLGVGYCVMEDVGGEGTVALRADPVEWDAGEMARAAAVMATFGGDRVVPYGIDASGTYDVASGEWQHPALFGGGEYTRRRHVAVNFAVKMFVEDVSPTGAAAGRKLARDTAIVGGTGGEFSALRNGYTVATSIARTAEAQHAVGGVRLALVWGTPGAAPPTSPGVYPLDVRVTDASGKPVGYVPVVQLSGIGIDGNRSSGAVATVDTTGDTADATARRNAAAATGWPTWDMTGQLVADARFAVGEHRLAADVTDIAGVARFTVAISGPSWELGFHTQAPTSDVGLYSGTGVQGQITWQGPPQSASVHQRVDEPGRIVIRKTLDATDVQGARDMSGFGFDVVRADDVTVGQALTGPDGRTAPVIVPIGRYRIVEGARPNWASGLVDDGPVTVTVTAGTTHDVTYTNRVAAASVTTSAFDGVDGDKYLVARDVSPPPWSDAAPISPIDGRPPTVIDRVTYRALVPGTPYVARGELVGVPGACADCPDVIARAETPFVPQTPDGVVDVVFQVHDHEARRGDTMVALQRIVVAGSGRVVAEHVDRTDPAQTVYLPAIDTDLRRAGDPEAPVGWAAREVVTGDAIVDVVTYSGLAVGERYRVELSLQQRLDDRTCVPTGARTSVDLTPTTNGGTVQVPGLAAPGPGVFVAYEFVWAGELLVASHTDCDDEQQTLWVADVDQEPPPTTSAPSTPTTAVVTAPSRPATTARPLARTGTDATSDALALGAGLLLCGSGLTLLARGPRRRELSGS
jgi:hypothetical protein